jgi:L-lactate dehydrogenase complex protein LldG
MTFEQKQLLKKRFQENGTQWIICEHSADIRSFLFRAGLDHPPFPHVQEGEKGFTLADGIIAETGSIILSGSRLGGRRAAILAETHFVLVAENAVFDTLGDFLRLPTHPWHRRTGHALTLITGPSRTADIEKTLVMGAHGPRKLVVATAEATDIYEFFHKARS